MVIPKKVRESLALTPGDSISFEIKRSGTMIQKIEDSPFDWYFGFLGKEGSTDKIIRKMRGDR